MKQRPSGRADRMRAACSVLLLGRLLTRKHRRPPCTLVWRHTGFVCTPLCATHTSCSMRRSLATCSTNTVRECSDMHTTLTHTCITTMMHGHCSLARAIPSPSCAVTHTQACAMLARCDTYLHACEAQRVQSDILQASALTFAPSWRARH